MSCVVYFHPYVLAFFPRSVDVLNLLHPQDVQSLDIPLGKKYFVGNVLLIGSTDTVWALTPIPVLKQVCHYSIWI
jgi:hypothetical protein